MARSLTPEQRRAIADRVNYYRDLGIYDLYKRAVENDEVPTQEQIEAIEQQEDSGGASSFREAKGWDSEN